MAIQRFHAGLMTLLALLLVGCASPYRAASDPRPANHDSDLPPFGAVVTSATASCPVSSSRLTAAVGREPLLSPGDRVALALEDGAEFSGSYSVGNDGYLRVPYVSAVWAQGLSVREAESELYKRMLEEQLLVRSGPRISLRPQLWAAVKVHVSGAVFAPGPVVVNDRTHVERRPDMKTRTGDFAPDRTFSAALRAAGGLRPDADLQQAVLQRDGRRLRVDLRPILDGHASDEIPLLDGDQIIIESTGLFQRELARPSAITPPGFRIYVSNLSIPSPSNAQSAVAGEATRLPMGARLSHALASANCIGGTQQTNAHRHALLVSRNPVTDTVTSHVYRVYDVTRRANEPMQNPYLMPEDAVACFDSSVTVVRDLARTALDVLLPIQVLHNIERGAFLYD